MSTRRKFAASTSLAVITGAALVSGCAGTAFADLASSNEPEPLDPETYQQILDQGVDPDAIHVIDLEGFSLITNSAGVIADDEYGAFYLGADGPHQAYFQVAEMSYSDESCADPVLWTPGGSYDITNCEPDDTGWYRSGQTHHQYVVVRDAYVLQLVAPVDGATREDLTAALLGAVRQEGGDTPTASPEPADPLSTTRGDLPPGDGAPRNEVGLGG